MAADTCIQTHGGYGFAADYYIERKFRETRLYQVAPGRGAMVAADHALLFRYSALTFDSHRIHYDRDYAMNEEAAVVWWFRGR